MAASGLRGGITENHRGPVQQLYVDSFVTQKQKLSFWVAAVGMGQRWRGIALGGAGAGRKAKAEQKPSKTCRVDPRACGGYHVAPEVRSKYGGRSPRVRRIQALQGVAWKHNGRSPLASAGEVPAVGFMQAVGHRSTVGLAGQAGVSIVTA